MSSALNLEAASRRLRHPLRELRYGHLRAVFDLHLPYFFFTLTLQQKNQISPLYIAMDAVTGQLNPVSFPASLSVCERVAKVDIRHLAPQLNAKESFECLTKVLHRKRFYQGFFKTRGLDISIVSTEMLYFPYFIGVFERGSRAHLEVLNGLQSQLEGAKIKDLVTQWFQSSVI